MDTLLFLRTGVLLNFGIFPCINIDCKTRKKYKNIDPEKNIDNEPYIIKIYYIKFFLNLPQIDFVIKVITFLLFLFILFHTLANGEICVVNTDHNIETMALLSSIVHDRLLSIFDDTAVGRSNIIGLLTFPSECGRS